jgi:TolB protein
MNTRSFTRILTALALVSGFAGCSQHVDPGSPVGPEPPVEPGPTVEGSLEVTVRVNGTKPDPDGYAVVIVLAGEDTPGFSVPVEPAGGTVRFSELESGSHSVRLENLAANCSIEGGSTRPFTVASDRITRVDFLVRCPGPGALLIKTVSRGIDLNSNSYALAVEATSIREERIGTSDSLLIEAEVSPGAVWIVRLSEVPDHCLVHSDVVPAQVIVSSDPLQIRMRGDVTVRVTFTATCFGSSKIAFHSGGDIQLLTFAGGGAVVNLTNHPAEDIWPALSPDRSRIVFSSDRDNPAGEFELYTMNVDGSGLVRLSNSSGSDWVGPQAWSPDGSRIVFSSMRDDPNGEIYIMKADGTGVIRLTENSLSDGCAAWSPDGSSIAFCREADIYRMGTTQGSPIVRIASEGFDPNWSPDGSKIAFMTGICWDTLCDLAVIGVDGTGFVQLNPDLANNTRALNPSWSPDGSWIAFTRMRLSSSEVAIVRFEGTRFGEIVHLTGGDGPSWR